MPFSSPGDLPDPGIEPASLMSPALAGGLFTTSSIWEAVKVVERRPSEVEVMDGPRGGAWSGSPDLRLRSHVAPRLFSLRTHAPAPCKGWTEVTCRGLGHCQGLLSTPESPT